ncbi:MAG: hypothetical protein AAGC56_10540 [Pseudomonadota bacterium]
MTKTVVCMKWGARYGPEYVRRLYAAVRRHVTGDLRFVCFTDDPAGCGAGVETQALPDIAIPDRVAWTPWRKLSLWRAPLHDLSGDVLFLDLDVVVAGPLDALFDYAPGRYAVIENWTQKGAGVGNTSVFRFPVGTYTHIFDAFDADPEAVLAAFRIEQQYISARIPDQVFWPADWVVSFKHSLLPPFPLNWFRTPALTPDARVVVFSGKPDPDEARDGVWPAPAHKRFYKHVRPTPWIAEHWG